jgi:hypothetical protein
MTEADTASPRHRLLTQRLALFGAFLGMVLGALLAVAEVTAGVPFETDEQGVPTFRVVILGVVVFRYPEDGDLFAMRPWPQAMAARNYLVLGSAFVGGVLGYLAARLYCRLTRRWS